MGQNWKVSEIAQIGKCQKLLRLESVRNSLDWSVSEIAEIGMCPKLLRLESARILNGEDWALLLLI